MFVTIALILMFSLNGLNSAPTPQNPDPSTPSVTEYSHTNFENGYTYSYLTDNSIYREETILLKNKGTPNEEFTIEGKYHFLGDDGYRYVVSYAYGNNGTTINVRQDPFKRIPPNALKSLVG